MPVFITAVWPTRPAGFPGNFNGESLVFVDKNIYDMGVCESAST